MAINPLTPVRGQTAFALREPQLASQGPTTASDISAVPAMDARRMALARVLAGQGNDGNRITAPGPGAGFGSRPIDMGLAGPGLSLAGLALGGVPGLALSAANMGVRANNMAFRDNVRTALDMDRPSFGRRLGGIFGFNDEGAGSGMIGDADIGNRGYGVSIGGGVIDGRTTLTADEAMKRAAIARGLERQKANADRRTAAGTGFGGATAAARSAGAFGNRGGPRSGGGVHGGDGGAGGGGRTSDGGRARH